MTDPVVEFVTEWIEANVTPEFDGGAVDPETVQEHLDALLVEAKDEGIPENEIEDSGLDVPALIATALKNAADGDQDVDDGTDD